MKTEAVRLLYPLSSLRAAPLHRRPVLESQQLDPLSADSRAKLQRGSHEGATLYTTSVTRFAVLLSGYSDEDQIVVGATHIQTESMSAADGGMKAQ
jgi:hypothetical protein